MLPVRVLIKGKRLEGFGFRGEGDACRGLRFWIMAKGKCYIQNLDGERSQVVKAVVCGTTIRGFESHRSP